LKKIIVYLVQVQSVNIKEDLLDLLVFVISDILTMGHQILVFYAIIVVIDVKTLINLKVVHNALIMEQYKLIEKI